MYRMAKILLSDTAPSGTAISFDFGADAQFTLGGGSKKADKVFETTDPAVLTNVRAHPWLAVEEDIAEPFEGAAVDQLAPADDHLSAAGAAVNVNDPEVARAAEATKLSGDTDPVAIDAGLDQDEVVEVGPVDKTIAAVEEGTE